MASAPIGQRIMEAVDEHGQVTEQGIRRHLQNQGMRLGVDALKPEIRRLLQAGALAETRQRPPQYQRPRMGRRVEQALPADLDRALTAYARLLDVSRRDALAYFAREGMRAVRNPAPWTLAEQDELQQDELPAHVRDHL